MVGQKVCRTCAKEDTFTQLIFLFGQEADQLDLRGKIKKYTPIEVDENDTLPKSICCSCKKTIIIWHEFWEQCIKIDKQLKAINTVSTEESCLKENIPVLPQPSLVNGVIDSSCLVGQKSDCALEPVSTKTVRGSYCIAKWCNNNNTKRRMFRLPRDKRCHIWLARADRNDLKECSMERLKNKYLCGDHFTDDMFTNANKNSLTWNAMPTVFPEPFPKRIPSPTTDCPDETFGGRFRPIKPSELLTPSSEMSKSSASSQATTSVSIDSSIGSLESLGLKQNVNKFQHILIMNGDEQKIYSELKNKSISRSPRESLLGTLRKKPLIDTITTDSEITNPVDTGTVFSNTPAVNTGVLTAVNTSEILKPQKTIENNEVEIAVVNNNERVVESEEFVNNIFNDGRVNYSQEIQIANTVTPINNKPLVDFTGANEVQSYFPHSPSSEILECIIPDSEQGVISRTRNTDVFSSGVVDSIDNFKVEDADSLYSSQFFPENMNSCLACGEVFLMKSSLAQHCKIYHAEKFDDSANISSSSHNSQT